MTREEIRNKRIASKAKDWIYNFFGRDIGQQELLEMATQGFDNDWEKNSKGKSINYNDFLRLMVDDLYYRDWKIRNDYIKYKTPLREKFNISMLLSESEFNEFIDIFTKYHLNNYNPKGYTEVEIRAKATAYMRKANRTNAISYIQQLDKKSGTDLYRRNKIRRDKEVGIWPEKTKC